MQLLMQPYQAVAVEIFVCGSKYTAAVNDKVIKPPENKIYISIKIDDFFLGYVESLMQIFFFAYEVKNELRLKLCRKQQKYFILIDREIER